MIGVESLDGDLAHLLGELSLLQDELLSVLAAKRERIAANDLGGLSRLNERASELCDRLEACQSRRQQLLSTARDAGLPAENLGRLQATLPIGPREELGKQAKEIGSRMRLLQHQCLTNWVVAQRALLHVSQLIEIIASGGRLQPTYGTEAESASRGSLMDSEA